MCSDRFCVAFSSGQRSALRARPWHDFDHSLGRFAAFQWIMVKIWISGVSARARYPQCATSPSAIPLLYAMAFTAMPGCTLIAPQYT